MEMVHPGLTKVYLIIGELSFFAMFIYLAQYVVFHYGRLSIQVRQHVLRGELISNPAIVILSIAIIVNSMLFTLFHGMDAHIRYALPSYTIILTGLVTLFFRYTLIASLAIVRKA
jgi:hypothetical protein